MCTAFPGGAEHGPHAASAAAVHAPRNSPTAQELVVHAWHSALPAAAVFPESHGEHVEELDAPTCGE